MKDGFRPEIRSVTGSEGTTELNVPLEPESGVSPSLRSCRSQRPGPLRELELGSARGLELKRGGDVDFTGYAAKYKANGSVASLTSMTGIHVSGLTPTPDWVAGLSAFTVRAVRCGGFQWIDLRGVSAGGLQSRWIGYAFGHVEYSKVPLGAARRFDDAIDRGCCR